MTCPPSEAYICAVRMVPSWHDDGNSSSPETRHATEQFFSEKTSERKVSDCDGTGFEVVSMGLLILETTAVNLKPYVLMKERRVLTRTEGG